MEMYQSDGRMIFSPANFNTSDCKELIDDIEHPAWTNLSLSESCHSQISSLCSDIQSFQTDCNSNHPKAAEAAQCTPQNALATFPSLSCLSDKVTKTMENQKIVSELSMSLQKEYETVPFLSESLQSLSSSNQTLYASPRDNSHTRLITSNVNMKKFDDKLSLRRGSLTRNQTPNEDSAPFHKSKMGHNFKLSHSLQDVSSIPSNTLQAQALKKSSKLDSSLNCKNKSRDSGLTHSDSLSSLNSNGLSFGHVQSKVKLYIQNLKEADAQRRKEREGMSRRVSHVSSKPDSEEYLSSSFQCSDLRIVVENMKIQMAEKDRLLCQLQENYDSLLQKYAEAETRIDRLRFGQFLSSQHRKQQEEEADTAKLPLLYSENRFSPTGETDSRILSWKAGSASPSEDFCLERDIDFCESSAQSSDLKPVGSDGAQFSMNSYGLSGKPYGKRAKKGILISAPLRPISRLYSTSVRLDRDFSPLPISELRPSLSNSASHNIEEECCSSAMQALPNEDPLTKVQRWQNSNGQFSNIERGVVEQALNKCNESDSADLSLYENKATKDTILGLKDPTVTQSERSSFKSLHSSWDSKTFVCQLCKGKCNNCGNTISVNLGSHSTEAAVADIKKLLRNSSENSQKILLSEYPALMDQNRSPKRKIFISNPHTPPEQDWISVPTGGCEQDHVVPNSPQNETSLETCLQNLKRIVCSTGKTTEQNSFAILLDALLKKSSKSFHHTEATMATTIKSDQTNVGFKESSLIDCLNEVDEYASELLMRNKSCLEKLDCSK